MNWSKEQSRASPLRRILPKRRGSRPGLKGAGLKGTTRGDLEQWEFLKVILTEEEKKLLIATMVELAKEAMFTYHFYGFGGRRFEHIEGGPIGLRGTCALARLIMQVVDRKWARLVEDAGLKIALYLRYMDDGENFSNQ